ncbi:MAG TPA: hypothetical protein VIW67_21600 [Terriglobales bacterium]|jgi:hypothetical protein
MRISDVLRRLVHNSDSSTQSLAEAVVGISNQSELINRKLSEAVNGIANQSDLMNQKITEASNQIQTASHRCEKLLGQMGERIDQLLIKMDSLIELQKAEIVMHREQAEATDELARLLGRKNNL